MRLIYGEEVMSDWFLGSWTGFFCVLYKSISIFILGNRFSLFDSSIFYSPILLLFYRSFHVFLTIAIYIYLCFAGEVLFRFLAFSFINHTTRISNITSFVCERLVVKKIIYKQSFPLYKTEMFCTGHSKPQDLTSK